MPKDSCYKKVKAKKAEKSRVGMGNRVKSV